MTSNSPPKGFLNPTRRALRCRRRRIFRTRRPSRRRVFFKLRMAAARALAENRRLGLFTRRWRRTRRRATRRFLRGGFITGMRAIVN